MDDDPLVCDSIRRMLEFDNCRVKSATSAADALTFCDQEKFDLVILDYLMPGTKGDKLALDIKSRFPALPILMITAAPERVESLAEKPPGVDLLLGKPFQLAELREAVARMLQNQPS